MSVPTKLSGARPVNTYTVLASGDETGERQQLNRILEALASRITAVENTSTDTTDPSTPSTSYVFNPTRFQVLGSNVDIAAGGINTGQLADSAVTNAKIVASAGITLSKLAAVTASRALVSDGSGFVSASSVTATELGYVSGVTSSIQTQLNTKALDSAVVHIAGTETITGAKTFSANVGVGVSANADWIASRRAVEIGGATVSALSLGAGISEALHNLYVSSSLSAFAYSTTAPAGVCSFNNAVAGGWSWQGAASGTVGTAASLSQWMQLTSTGLGVNGSATVGGTTTSGPSAVGGSIAYQIPYSGADILNTWGAFRSSGGTLMAYGVKPGTASAVWNSSTSIGIARMGYVQDTDGHHFLTSSVVTTAIDSAVTMTERFTVATGGNIGVGTASPTDTIGFGRAVDVQSSTGGAVYVRDSDIGSTSYAFLGADAGRGYVGTFGSGYEFTIYAEGVGVATFFSDRLAVTGAVSATTTVQSGTGFFSTEVYSNGSVSGTTSVTINVDNGAVQTLQTDAGTVSITFAATNAAGKAGFFSLSVYNVGGSSTLLASASSASKYFAGDSVSIHGISAGSTGHIVFYWDGYRAIDVKNTASRSGDHRPT